jgi:hypothetical protein
MSIEIYDSSFDVSHGLRKEDALRLIPRMELQEPYNDGELIFATYWQHMRTVQLMQKEYQLNPTEANLKRLLSLLYELPPPYKVEWLSKEYHKQAERLEQLRQNLIKVKS